MRPAAVWLDAAIEATLSLLKNEKIAVVPAS